MSNFAQLSKSDEEITKELKVFWAFR